MLHDQNQENFIAAPIGQLRTGEPAAIQVCSAGAGTGKTTTVARKINHLIAQGVPASEIVAITFTRAAAQALQARVEQKIGFAGTLHSFALRALGAKDIMTVPETEDLIKSTLASIGLGRMTLDWARGILQSGDNDHLGDARVFLRTITAAAINQGKMPFDLALRTFAFGDQVVDRRGLNPQVLIVDEFQDSSELDMACFRRIDPSRAFVVIGDERQAIYGFRGANPAVFRRAIRKATTSADRGSGVFPLNLTFRCARTIVDLANRIQSESSAPPLDVHDDADPGRIEARIFDNARDEEDALIREAGGRSGLRSAAVLTRYNADVERIRLAFRGAGIAVRPRISVERLSQGAIEKQVIGYLNACLEPVAFANDLIRSLPPRVQTEVLTRAGGEVSDVINWMNQSTSLARKLDILWAPVDVRRHWAIEEAGDSAARAYEAIMGAVDGTTEPEAGGIYVDTVHAVKGLEFDTVLLACADTRWDTDKHDQAANLLYVAVTRARTEFFATSSKTVIDPWTREVQSRTPSRILWSAIEGR
jgi:superfamily I DNA/RNA helicase